MKKYILVSLLFILPGLSASAQSMEEIFESGRKSFYSDDFDGANKQFMQILNSESDDYLTHYYKGRIYEIYFDNEKAISELSLSISRKKNFGAAYFSRAVILEKTGDTSRAISDYTSAIKSGEKTADAYFNRATLYQETGETEKAIKDYGSALKINPMDDIAYYNRGLLYFGLGEIEKARSDFLKAIEIDSAWNNELKKYLVDEEN